jgi:hypothetical protein
MIGSRAVVNSNPKWLEEGKYKRCIAFDRYGYTSIITYQSAGRCCSEDFSSALSSQFASVGLEGFKSDSGGIFTDSAAFMNTIPECTNLSVGYYGHHSHAEQQDIDFLRALCQACVKVNWEELPIVRDHKNYETYSYASNFESVSTDTWYIFYDVDDIMILFHGASCINFTEFSDETDMVYVIDGTEKEIIVNIYSDGTIKIGNNLFQSYQEIIDYYKEKHNFDAPSTYTSKYKIDISGNNTDDDSDDNGTHHPAQPIEDIAKEFTTDLNMDKFVEDVMTSDHIVEDERGRYIEVDHMKDILDKHDRHIEPLIFWIFNNDNNSEKTMGITWDEMNTRFSIC